MAEFLEATFGKFIFRVRVGYLYSKDDFWASIRGNVAVIGLADFLQKSGGDVAFIETVAPGMPVKYGQEAGKIETMKAIFGIISPATGKVTKVNPEMETSPHLINSDPYGAGWIYEIELADPENSQRTLLGAEEYMKLMMGKVETEAKRLDG